MNRHAGYALTAVFALTAIVAWPCRAQGPITDLDGSGRVDAADIQMVINAALGLLPSDGHDVDGSGAVNATDVQLVINAALGLLPPEPQPGPTGNAFGPMGINIHYVNYYDQVMYFPEVTRQGSRWIVFNPESGEWSLPEDDPRQNLSVDENGYPTELAPDQGVRMIIFMDSEVMPAGDYTLVWEGSGTLEIDGNGARTVFEPEDASPQAVSIPPSESLENYLFLAILATDPADPVRNIRMYAPGYDPETAPLFMPHLAELANELGKDIWVCVPHAATEDYIRQMATLFRDRLEPDRRIWVEYTNEAWNSIFSQFDWLAAEAERVAQEENREDFYLYHMYGRYAIRALEIFEEVFDGGDRVVAIMSGFSAWSDPLRMTLDEVERLGKTDVIETVAIAPYFGLNAEDNSDPILLALRSALPEITEEEWADIFPLIEERAVSIMRPGNEYGDEMLANRAMAQDLGVPLTCYEAGQHFVNWYYSQPELMEELGDVFVELNARPEMYDVYQGYLDEWQAFGGSTMTMFHLAGSWYGLEAFGHMRSVLQPIEEAHKYRALLDWLAAQAP